MRGPGDRRLLRKALEVIKHQGVFDVLLLDIGRKGRAEGPQIYYMDLAVMGHEELHKAVGVRVLYKQQLPALISRLYDRKWLVAA